jgi:hypothetical protein
MTDERDGAVEPTTDPRVADAAAATEAGDGDGDGQGDGERAPLTSAEYSIAFSPRNVAIGLAIVAGVIALAARRRRRGRRSDADEDA